MAIGINVLCIFGVVVLVIAVIIIWNRMPIVYDFNSYIGGRGNGERNNLCEQNNTTKLDARRTRFSTVNAHCWEAARPRPEGQRENSISTLGSTIPDSKRTEPFSSVPKQAMRTSTLNVREVVSRSKDISPILSSTELLQQRPSRPVYAQTELQKALTYASSVSGEPFPKSEQEKTVVDIMDAMKRCPSKQQNLIKATNTTASNCDTTYTESYPPLQQSDSARKQTTRLVNSSATDCMVSKTSKETDGTSIRQRRRLKQKHQSKVSTVMTSCTNNYSNSCDKLHTKVKTNKDAAKSLKQQKEIARVAMDVADDAAVDDQPLTKEEVINMNPYRQEANEHAELRNYYFQSAKHAYDSGDKEGASTYSKLGHTENGRMHEANRKAADFILKTFNPDFPQCSTLDLHGLHVSEALNFLDEFLEAHENDGDEEVYVITGKGNHSDNGRPRLRPTIMDHFNKKPYMYTEDEVNKGEFTVHLL